MELKLFKANFVLLIINVLLLNCIKAEDLTLNKLDIKAENDDLKHILQTYRVLNSRLIKGMVDRNDYGQKFDSDPLVIKALREYLRQQSLHDIHRVKLSSLVKKWTYKPRRDLGCVFAADRIPCDMRDLYQFLLQFKHWKSDGAPGRKKSNMNNARPIGSINPQFHSSKLFTRKRKWRLCLPGTGCDYDNLGPESDAREILKPGALTNPGR